MESLWPSLATVVIVAYFLKLQMVVYLQVALR